MDTVFKVCDAMENVTFSVATVVPRCFVCGMDDIDEAQEERLFESSCGDLTTKFASHHLDQFVEDNSVCIKTGNDDHNDKGVTSNHPAVAPLHSKELNTVNEAVLRKNEKFGKENSWASIDGRQPARYGMMSEYSASVPEFQERSQTDDDKSTRSLADRIDEGEEVSSDNDPINMTVSLDKIGLGLFGLPLQWTHPVKKKSSWNSNSSSKKTSSTTTNSSGNESSGISPKNSRDDFNSLEQKDSASLGDYNSTVLIKKNSSLGTIGSKTSDLGFESSHNEGFMIRELPSFGKSREFRSFGSSNRSLEDQSALYSLKPTYMSADESKQLHEESSRYKYIIHRSPSDRSSTASSAHTGTRSLQNSQAELECLTTTIPYSSLSKAPTPKKKAGSTVSTSSKRSSFEKVFRNPFPKKLNLSS
eukprot:CAMPEP_0116126480 /NCGR_PEP_ID=MMETSP0329-20121206/6353_1 /TAXON_ID=697910 /ORGANISM="Pseudo-nitzschia arenysensis, Strain B593" /LENGTH=417 /DNA_ID=CAMNT_0003620563 /DNA_START=214 /DNA_END=1470 /DNA_ORIENTATION=+